MRPNFGARFGVIGLGALDLRSLLTLCALLLAPSAFAAERPGVDPVRAPRAAKAPLAPSVGAEDRAVFDLFRGLDLPTNLGLRPFVNVTENRRSGRFRGCCRGYYQPLRGGFLLAADKKTFTVTHGLWPIVYDRTRVNRWAQAPRFTQVDLTTALRALLQPKPTRRKRRVYRHRNKTLQLARSQLARQRARTSYTLELVLLARGLHERGMVRETVDVLRVARGRLTYPALKMRIERELPRALLWETVDACSRKTMPRPELLRRFERIARRFPQALAGKQARRMAGLLRPLVEETSRTPQLPRKPVGRTLSHELLELGEPLPKLIHALRDMSLAEYEQVSYTRAQLRFGGGIGARNNPGLKLRAAGLGAVPALLEMLGDRRPTRIQPRYVAGTRANDPAHHLLSHGQVALAILSGIAGRRMVTSHEARAWWGRVQKEGELNVLAAMAAEGKGDTINLWRRVLARDTQRALQIAGPMLTKLAGDWPVYLVNQLAARQEPQVRDLLLTAVRRGRSLSVRLAAARALDRRRCDLWEAPLLSAVQTLGKLAHTRYGPRYSRQAVRMLVTRGGRYTLQAFPRLLPRLGVDQRGHLITTLRTSPSEAADAVLIAALADRSIPIWSPLRTNGGTLYGPQLREMAAAALLARRRRAFDFRAAPWERERALVALQNEFRARAGQPRLPLPPVPRAPRVDPNVAAAIALEARLATTPTQVMQALQALRGQGLAGVAPLTSALALPLEVHHKLTLRRWIREQSSLVREVVVEDPDKLLPPAVRGRWLALRGQTTPLRGQHVVQRIRDQLKGARSVAFSIGLHRDAQGLGVTLRIGVRRVRSRYVQFGYTLRQGRSTRNRCRGSHSARYLNDRYGKREWQTLTRLLDGVLQGRSGQDGELRLQLVLR